MYAPMSLCDMVSCVRGNKNWCFLLGSSTHLCMNTLFTSEVLTHKHVKGLTCLGIGLLSCATLCSNSMQGGLTWWNVSAWCLLFLDGVHEGAQRPNSSWWCLFCGRAGFSLSSLVSKTGMCYFIGCLIQAALLKGVNVQSKSMKRHSGEKVNSEKQTMVIKPEFWVMLMHFLLTPISFHYPCLPSLLAFIYSGEAPLKWLGNLFGYGQREVCGMVILRGAYGLMGSAGCSRFWRQVQ